MKNLYFCLLASALLLAGCNTTTDKRQETAAATTPPVADTTDFNIAIGPLPPREAPANATPQQLAEFAWGEFFALNWQASYPKSHRRDDPDTSWSFGSPGAFPPLVVWETFAHRTELRPAEPKNDTTTSRMQPFDSIPHYRFITPVGPYLSPGPRPSFTLFDNLDENNEIGSCDVYGQINQPDGKNMVLYQAKVNRVEYDYILHNFGTNALLKKATKAQTVSIAKDTAYYKGGRGKSTCDCPPGVICLPCGSEATNQGTIEIKSAWRQLTKADDASKFLTRRVIYYRHSPNPKDKTIYYDNATFALIGLHIIHKTVNYPNFVFATWEHVGVENDNMGLAHLDAATGTKEITGIHRYQRQHAITGIANQATAAAHRKLRALNPQSVWLNYRLVGVQGTPTNDSTSTNFFLANYVVESDSTLAGFHGSGIGQPHDHGYNSLYRGNLLSMGGCQGCHGVAQMKLGTDLSFLLDQVGKPVNLPDADKNSHNKLNRYIQATAPR
ncbi:MAG: hypothetical protein M3Y54_19950 [Bacteroidota bacterium]|nr:hypothetical protein [Bacteroidota bacterium]